MGKQERAIFRELLKAAVSPGPLAAYDVERAIKLNRGKVSPRMTISKKFVNNSQESTPGPGSYDTFLNATMKDFKGYTIG